MDLPFAESYKIKMVEPLRKSTREEREKWIKEADYNLFQLKSDQVYIDCLTDSGTGAMSDRQWAAMMMGDESYAGSSSFFQLKETITRITGFEYVIPTHQGRAAENVLFSHLVKAGDIVPGNSHFDTTKGHIESRKATALDCTIDEAKDTQLEIPFKGNVDPEKLEKALAEHHENVPFIIVTITNNTAGGQPVSMQNLREVRAIADKYGKRVVYDLACSLGADLVNIRILKHVGPQVSVSRDIHRLFVNAQSIRSHGKAEVFLAPFPFFALLRLVKCRITARGKHTHDKRVVGQGIISLLSSHLL